MIAHFNVLVKGRRQRANLAGFSFVTHDGNMFWSTEMRPARKSDDRRSSMEVTGSTSQTSLEDVDRKHRDRLSQSGMDSRLAQRNE